MSDRSITLRGRLRAVPALLLLLLLLAPSFTAAADQAPDPLQDRPHWSLELKGGRFTPAAEDWQTYYGEKSTWHIAGSVAYKVLRQAEIGLEGGMIKDTGHGLAPTNNVITGTVEYEIWPLHAFALVRAVFAEGQWLVPYAGGGWTRVYYREKIEQQATARGSVDGSHYRFGLQLLLDKMDPGAANNLFQDFGIRHTYLFVESQVIKADTEDATGATVKLGGKSILYGLLFEF